jgi:segregation and condensation protein A
MESDSLVLQLEGFEGPLDLLLELARAQKVDLAKISILALVEQIKLELAADWLVMAAWLTWLKSRLLVPVAGEPDDAEQAADILASRLLDLQATRAAAAWLGQRFQLNWDVFPRGEPENFTETDRSRLSMSMSALLSAYLAARRRAGAKLQYQPKMMSYFSVQNALERLARLVGSMPDWSALEAFLPAGLSSLPDWSSLEAFLPKDLGGGLPMRAALSSTLVASLEMARAGGILLRQETQFGPILVHKGENERF